MIVLDASVLIAHLDALDAHHRRAGALLAASGADPLGASVVTMAEVLVGPARAGRVEQGTSALHALGVAPLPLDAVRAPSNLAVLRAQTGLKLPDCCVLLAALDTEGEIATFDERLARAAVSSGLAVRT